MLRPEISGVHHYTKSPRRRQATRIRAYYVGRNCFLLKPLNEGQKSASPQSWSKFPGILQLAAKRRPAPRAKNRREIKSSYT